MPRREEKGSAAVLVPRPGVVLTVGWRKGSLGAVCDPTAPVRKDMSSTLVSTLMPSPPPNSSSKSMSSFIAVFWSSAFNSSAVFISDSDGGLFTRERVSGRAPVIKLSLVVEGGRVGM